MVKYFFTVKLWAGRDDFFEQGQDFVLGKVFLFFRFGFHHVDAGIEQECAGEGSRGVLCIG